MAAVDGTRGDKSSSEESFQFECSPCKNDDIVKEAKFYCPECQEYLCELCEASHKRFRITRNHNVVLCTDILEKTCTSEEQEVVNTSTICCCGRLESEVYCVYHNEIVCSDCNTTKHWHCQTKLINEFVADLDTDFGAATLAYTDKLKEKIINLQTKRKQSLKTLSADTDIKEKEISAFGRQLKQKIDTIQKRAVKDLRTYSKLHKDIVQHHLDVCDTVLRALAFGCSNFQKLKGSRNERESFLSHLKLTTTLKESDAVINDITEEVLQPRLSFDRNEDLSFILQTESLGVVTHNLRLKPGNFNADMTVDSSSEVNIRLDSDRRVPWISGSTFLPNGDLVLCDMNNNCIKLFDPEFKSRNRKQVSSSPRDCCLINHDEVLITLPDQKEIHRYQTSPSFRLKKTITLDQKCEGITSLNQDVFVCCHSLPDKEIRILDKDGHLKQRITLNEPSKRDFFRPLYIAVSNKGQIYVSEETKYAYDKQQIRCFSSYGILMKTATYPTYPKKEISQGDVGGLLIDVDNLLLACFCHSNSVHLFNKDCSDSISFLPNEDLKKPYSISFRGSDSSLIVTFSEQNHILVCKMK